MSGEVFKSPRKKKGAKKLNKESAFPVPIQSITKKDACDNRWFHYTGYFLDNCVVVEDLGDLTFLYKMGFFGKGNLSRSKPEYEIISDISQKAFSNSEKLRRLPPKERQIRQSKFREIRKERFRNHSCWQELAKSSKETVNSKKTEEATDKEEAHVKPCGKDSLGKESSRMMKIYDDELELFQDDSSDSDDNIDSFKNDASQMHSNKDINITDNGQQTLTKNTQAQTTKGNGNKRKKKVDPYKVFEHLLLTLEEAFFLSYGLGCLSVFDDNKKVLSVGDMWKAFSQVKKNFMPCYIAYHYYRSKGWVPKSGIKYGTDFVIYKEGMPFYHSSYSVVIQAVDKNTFEPVMTDICRPYKWSSVTGLNRVSEHAAKEIMICYVLVPSDITETSPPCCIPRFEVQEVILRRWIPERSREPVKV